MGELNEGGATKCATALYYVIRDIDTRLAVQIIR